MAKKSADGVNKSQAIRDYYKANRKAKPKQVVEAMAEQGIKVSAQYVSTIRTNSKKKSQKKGPGRPVGRPAGRPAGRKAGRPAAKSTGGQTVNLDSLLRVKEMVEEVGGIEEARTALAALERLSSN